MAALNRAGDFGYDGLTEYVTAMEKWFFAQQRIAFENAILPDGKWRLCLGVLVYGAYVDRFLRFCVPSLLAPGNIGALADPLIIIHTDEDSVGRLAAGLEELRKLARIEIHTVPAHILAMVRYHECNRYWLLGAACNLHMQQAKYRAHSYHMLMPDLVYSTGYFANLNRLRRDGKHAIVQGAMSAQMEHVAPELERSRCAIEPERLGALALDNLHPRSFPFVVNGRTDLPVSLLLLLVGSAGVSIVTPHMTIIYLSHEVLMRAPLRLFNTTDAQLPFLIPDDVEPYVPTATDGMVYIELSDASQKAMWHGGCTIDEFCARFWVLTYCVRGYERYFGMTTVTPLPFGHRSNIKPMPDDEISDMVKRVRSAVSKNYETIYSMLPDELRIDPLARAQGVTELVAA